MQRKCRFVRLIGKATCRRGYSIDAQVSLVGTALRALLADRAPGIAHLAAGVADRAAVPGTWHRVRRVVFLPAGVGDVAGAVARRRSLSANKQGTGIPACPL